jgi:MoxR-like ATPase
VATQNPVEYEGTYPLPEAQLDRFLFKLEVGYPAEADEVAMLRLPRGGVGSGDLERVRAVVSEDELRAAAAAVDAVRVAPELHEYVVALVRQTRADGRLYLGASPRAGIALARVAKANALAQGRDYLLPDDVKAVAEHVLAHRLILAPEARAAGLSPGELVRDAVDKTPVPV